MVVVIVRPPKSNMRSKAHLRSVQSAWVHPLRDFQARRSLRRMEEWYAPLFWARKARDEGPGHSVSAKRLPAYFPLTKRDWGWSHTVTQRRREGVGGDKRGEIFRRIHR